MNIVVNMPLTKYKFHGYAKETASKLTPKELEKIDNHFNENPNTCYPEYHINNLFTFDVEQIAKIIGTTKEEIENR